VSAAGTIGTAFVLGAGLGTRLRPLTNERPKPLVPVFHKPLITFAFDHLRAFGVERFVVNTHHRPEAYGALLGEKESRAAYAGDFPVWFSHEPVLLDTAGGIKNAEPLIGRQHFLVHNGDVLADLALDRLIRTHLESGNVATVGLRSFGGPLHVQMDSVSGRMTDIRGKLGKGSGPSYLFIGIYALSPEIFDWIPPGEALSVIPVFLRMIEAGKRVGGVVLDEGIWFDLGERSSYLEAHQMFSGGGWRLSYPLDRPWPIAVHPSARVAETAVLEGVCAIGPGAVVGEGAVVRDSVVWERAEIASRARLEGCIVRDGRIAAGELRGADL